jgi:large subunit ribosomal protein L23
MADFYKVIKTVVLTEKSNAASENDGKYTFKVAKNANKIQIAQAVESLFDVKVAAVNTMNYTGKSVRQRTKNAGKKADYKKAVVTLKGDSEINFY